MTRKDILQLLAKFQRDRRDEFGIVRLGIFGSIARISLAMRVTLMSWSNWRILICSH